MPSLLQTEKKAEIMIAS